ncbi:hypothetical protein [Sporosarcina sp. D27]|uniref:hypothetical protein n=1 Tax=Sporosarcina sp. D27 TaxID=1382305 RepID=UPI00046F9B00|nr:hypothetical protein [Sporosarcina sp. D27]
MKDNIKHLAELTGLEVNDLLAAASDSIPGMVPIVGGIFDAIKHKRLINRLNSIECKIDEMRTEILNETNQEKFEFIQNFAFPLFLQKLLEEDEELKIKYLINGITRVVKGTNLNESHLILVFDILDQLRSIEIGYLISLIEESSFIEEENLSSNMIKYIESKLEKLGLLEVANKVSFIAKPEKESVAMAYADRTSATELGKELINFID